MEIRSDADEALFLEMNNASDRTAAIVAGAYLEDKLQDLLRAYLKPDKDTFKKLFRPAGPMGPLGNKVDLGYMLGLYSRAFRDDLSKITEIRNRFAHISEPITFGTKVILDLCEEISFSRRLFDRDGHQSGPKPFSAGFSKFWYISTIDMMAGHIIEMTRDPKHPKVF